MSWAGLPFSTVAAVLGAAALATGLLYVLRERRRAVEVPFAPLWQRVLADQSVAVLFARLRRLLSLALQLALLALLALAALGPRTEGSSADGRSLVVLLDTSASMQAEDEIGGRITAAKAEARALLRGLAPGDRALVAAMGPRTVPLTPLTDDVDALVRAVDSAEALDVPADLGRALAFARDVLRDAPSPEVVLVSDGALDVPPADPAAPPLSWLRVGEGGRNAAITAFAVRRYPLDASRVESLLEVTNTDSAPVDVELSLLGDGRVLDVSRLSLAPGERVTRVHEDLGGAPARLEARLALAGGGHDLLRADDVAYARVPDRRRATVDVVTSGNTYLEAALLLDEYLEVRMVPPDGAGASGADVTILDGVAPREPPRGSSLYLAPPAEGGPVALGRRLVDFGFDTWDAKSPLLRSLAVENVQVARGTALVPAGGDRVVGASEGGAILVSGSREGRPFVALGFDPRDSDLVLRPAWPLFVLNVVRSFVETDSTYLSSLRTGEPWALDVPAGST
ncbi:MAG: VWA domain-containing protein, partial [Deltaproteobacteria bacterium]|nr:VWA domain-containing protein [Deltaproteobacteria bacterium]